MNKLKFGFICVWTVLLIAIPSLFFGFSQKKTKGSMDDLSFKQDRLRVISEAQDYQGLKGMMQNTPAYNNFFAREGTRWHALVDRRTGKPELFDGGSIPWVAGKANNLKGPSNLTIQTLESIARDFITANHDIFKVNQEDLALMDNSGLFGGYLWFVNFQVYKNGIPVDDSYIYFRVNNGNLIQFGTSHLGDISVDTKPSITPATAWDVIWGYTGDHDVKNDTILNKGELVILPVLPNGQSASNYNGPVGSGIEYALVYKMAFKRTGSFGTWEALVDAHSGDLLGFYDANQYGSIKGGIYPVSQYDTQVSRPFPYADYLPGQYADAAGNFTYPGGTVTSTLSGKYVMVNDTCGPISLSNGSAPGDLDFQIGLVPSDNGNQGCITPGVGGSGNTHASRTSYYHLTQIKMKALSYLPANVWLQGQLLDNINLNSICNAFWDGFSVNFYRYGGGCADTGELAGVFIHEWGHGLDDNDGGPFTSPGEGYADIVAELQLHVSCMGTGFLLGSNCGGYGDSCLSCDGVRDVDWNMHASHTPFKASLNGSPGMFSCWSSGYSGPCGWEAHCEAAIPTQAIWDMGVRDLTSAPTSMDQTSAWQLMDRLWYLSTGQLNMMYSCTPPNSNGCGGTSIYTLFRAVDDDGDGTANGTPHAAAIFAALDRHAIACGLVSDPTNQNQTTCPSLTTPVLSGLAGNNSVILNWGAVTNANSYNIFRNESGCSYGYTKIGSVTAPTVTFTDNFAVNGLSYYYVVQAVGTNASCTSPVSNCVTVVPQPFAGLITLDSASYSCADIMTIGVTDADLVGLGTQVITVWSTTEPTPENVTLSETPANSGIYSGTFPTTSAAPANGDGMLSVANGASITAKYIDADDHQGNCPCNRLANATADCVAPIISNVAVSNITDSTALVTWTTNEPSDSTVTYDTTTPPGLTAYVGTMTTAHSVTVTGLTGCTLYYFSVTSADSAGNSTTDNNGGAYYTFTTAGRVNIFADDVESGNMGWTTSGAFNAWHIDTLRSNSPTHSWYCGSGGGYSDYYDEYLVSQVIDLGTSGGGSLSFATYYDLEASYDYGYVDLSTDGGTNWTNLATYNGNSGSFLNENIDLSAYNGTINVRFHMTSDTSVTYEGWYVDDIRISVPAPCTPSPQYYSHTITDSCNVGGPGNGNGIAEPGELLNMPTTLKNIGMLPATGVSAILSSTTPGVVIVSGSSTYPDMVSGATAVSNTNYIVQLPSNIACQSNVSFNLAITSNEGSWNSSFTQAVGGWTAGAPVTYNSTDVPKSITDYNTVTSTISIPNTSPVSDVNVQLNITHTWDSDLDIYLIGPDGTRVELSTDNGGSGDNFTNTIFDDEAVTPITSGTAPFAGSYRPEGLLSTLDGIPANGTWTLEITDDAGGDTGTLNSWSIILTPSVPVCNICTSDNYPTVSITSPTNGANVGGVTTITATASDDNGVTQVEFFVDAGSIGIDTTSPYSMAWDTTISGLGAHTLTACATDTIGQVTCSSPVNVTVVPDAPPTVSILNPKNGSTVCQKTTISVSATDDFGIASVAFYIDGVLKYTDTTFPYSYYWDSSGRLGVHTIMVCATDTIGQQTCQTINVTVNKCVADYPPTIKFISPINQQIVWGIIKIRDSASDDHGINKVEFYVNNILQATATTFPYSFTWDTTSVPDGWYTLMLVAYDTALQTTAATVNVHVVNSGPPPIVTGSNESR